MRLRRMEFAIVGITLAFAFFMGGFFTGRSHNPVSITAAAIPADNPAGMQISIANKPGSDNEQAVPEQTLTPAGADNGSITAVQTAPPIRVNEAPPQGTGEPKQTDGKININTATHGELTDLPGIGDTLASRIIDYRTQNGVFVSIEDIQNVSGIGERRFEAIMEFITVG